jgi:hypothetical protein
MVLAAQRRTWEMGSWQMVLIYEPFHSSRAESKPESSRGDYLRTARADGRPSTARQQQIRFVPGSVHAPICTSTGLFVLISHENWCLGLP